VLHGPLELGLEAVWHMLVDLDGVELLLCNARHVKRVPGRKTDVSDAAWLRSCARSDCLTGSFVPPPEIARLRDLTRYRKKLINERGRETQRIQKLLEDTVHQAGQRGHRHPGQVGPGDAGGADRRRARPGGAG
jgi:transposase